MIPLYKILKNRAERTAQRQPSAVAHDSAIATDGGTSEGAKKGWVTRRGKGSLIDRASMSAEERAVWEEQDAQLAAADKEKGDTAIAMLNNNADAADELLKRFNADIEGAKTAADRIELAMHYYSESQDIRHDIEQYVLDAKNGGKTDAEINAAAAKAHTAMKKLDDCTNHFLMNQGALAQDQEDTHMDAYELMKKYKEGAHAADTTHAGVAIATDAGTSEGVKKSWLKRERAKKDAQVDTLDKYKPISSAGIGTGIFYRDPVAQQKREIRIGDIVKSRQALGEYIVDSVKDGTLTLADSTDGSLFNTDGSDLVYEGFDANAAESMNASREFALADAEEGNRSAQEYLENVFGYDYGISQKRRDFAQMTENTIKRSSSRWNDFVMDAENQAEFTAETGIPAMSSIGGITDEYSDWCDSKVFGLDEPVERKKYRKDLADAVAEIHELTENNEHEDSRLRACGWLATTARNDWKDDALVKTAESIAETYQAIRKVKEEASKLSGDHFGGISFELHTELLKLTVATDIRLRSAIETHDKQAAELINKNL